MKYNTLKVSCTGIMFFFIHLVVLFNLLLLYVLIVMAKTSIKPKLKASMADSAFFGLCDTESTLPICAGITTAVNFH